jgi:hypothetical protein
MDLQLLIKLHRRIVALTYLKYLQLLLDFGCHLVFQIPNGHINSNRFKWFPNGFLETKTFDIHLEITIVLSVFRNIFNMKLAFIMLYVWLSSMVAFSLLWQ